MTQEYEYYLFALKRYKEEKDAERRAYYKGIIDAFKRAHQKELNEVGVKYQGKTACHYA